MAQLERRKKLSDSPNSPNSQTSPASDQLLRVDEAYWAAVTSPSAKVCHEHLHEECPSTCPSHNKKSVIAKVKETAKKLKYSLSGRRKLIELHDHDHDLHLHDSHPTHTHIHPHSHSHDDRRTHIHIRDLADHDDRRTNIHIRDHDNHDDSRTRIHIRDHDNHDDRRTRIHIHTPTPDHDEPLTHTRSHEHDDLRDNSHGHDDCHAHIHEQHHDHVTPCWTATLEDDYLNEKDYDPEYLGAPMYESEAAPDCLKETARQHPRAVPVVSESHRAPNMAKLGAALQENSNKQVSLSSNAADSQNTNMITSMTQTVSEKLAPAINTNMITNMTQTVSDKLGPACAAVSDATHQINAEMISNVTGSVSEKLAPACAAVSDATHQIASKLAGISITAPDTQQRAHETSGYIEVEKMGGDAGNLMQCTSGSPQTWDKGVSVKEYFLHKLEPGEDERALSQAITEAISPRNSTGDTGMVDKVKGAVTSLFWQDDASDSAEESEGLISSAALATSDIPRTVQLNRVDSIRLEKPASPSPVAPATSNVPLTAQMNRMPSVHVRSAKILGMDSAISSPNIPLSTNALEVYEEENHGKILQTN